MRVFVDGKQILEPTPSLAAALAVARCVAESTHRIVIDAQLDGRPIADEILASPPTIAGEGDLHCQTADPVELVCSTLEGVADALNDAKTQQKESARLIRLGQFETALGMLRDPLQTWETVRQSILDGTTLVGFSTATTGVEIQGQTVTVDAAVRALADRLAEVKRALNAKDWSGLADVLGYDLVELAEAWQTLLMGLASQMRQARPTPSAPAR